MREAWDDIEQASGGFGGAQDKGRRVPAHGSGPAKLPPQPNRGEATALFNRLPVKDD